VREIDHADDAEHHGVADRDQTIDRAERDTIDNLLEEVFHLTGSFVTSSATHGPDRTLAAGSSDHGQRIDPAEMDRPNFSPD
jgi:hypothetical protein